MFVQIFIFMPLKQKEYFNIAPNDNIKYPVGTFFVYHNGEYFFRYITDQKFNKVVPWEIFNVTKPLVTDELKETYKNGAIWLKDSSGWRWLGDHIVEAPVSQGGIGYWAIGIDFTIS